MKLVEMFRGFKEKFNRGLQELYQNAKRVMQEELNEGAKAVVVVQRESESGEAEDVKMAVEEEVPVKKAPAVVSEKAAVEEEEAVEEKVVA